MYVVVCFPNAKLDGVRSLLSVRSILRELHITNLYVQDPARCGVPPWLKLTEHARIIRTTRALCLGGVALTYLIAFVPLTIVRSAPSPLIPIFVLSIVCSLCIPRAKLHHVDIHVPSLHALLYYWQSLLRPLELRRLWRSGTTVCRYVPFVLKTIVENTLLNGTIPTSVC